MVGAFPTGPADFVTWLCSAWTPTDFARARVAAAAGAGGAAVVLAATVVVAVVVAVVVVEDEGV